MSKQLKVWNLLGNPMVWLGAWFGDGYSLQGPHILRFFPITLPIIGTTVWLSIVPIAVWIAIVHPRVSEKIGLVRENNNSLWFKGRWIRKSPKSDFDAKTEVEKWRLKDV